MFKHNPTDQCDHCHKETPYYLLTMIGSGEAVCIDCLQYVEDEYDHSLDEDFED